MAEPRPHETGMFRVGGIEVVVHVDGSVLIMRRGHDDRIELGDYEAATLLQILGAMRAVPQDREG